MFRIIEIILFIVLFAFSMYRIYIYVSREKKRRKSNEELLINITNNLKNPNCTIPKFDFNILQDKESLKINNTGDPLNGEIINTIWNSVMSYAQIIVKENDTMNIVMYNDSEKLFKENFDYYESVIKKNFMSKNSDELDRHKISAIIICSLLHNDILGFSAKSEHKVEYNNAFLANEKLALKISIRYMYEQLIRDMKKGIVPYSSVFPNYVFPKPFSCDRDYEFVLCRDLYYAKKYFSLNPLSIANLLFLIEEYSFVSYGLERDDSLVKKTHD